MVPIWSENEEKAFADIQAVSRLTRIEAIRLWKRCRKDVAESLLEVKQKPSTT